MKVVGYVIVILWVIFIVVLGMTLYDGTNKHQNAFEQACFDVGGTIIDRGAVIQCSKHIDPCKVHRCKIRSYDK